MTERENEARYNVKVNNSRNIYQTVLLQHCVDVYLWFGADALKVPVKELIRKVLGVYIF